MQHHFVLGRSLTDLSYSKYTMSYTAYVAIGLVGLVSLILFCCAPATCSVGTQSHPLNQDLTVIPDEGSQCPRGVESLDEILQNVSTLLQDVVNRKLLGTNPENAGNSCAEITEQKPNCPSGNYFVLNSTGSAVQVYCEMGDVFPDSLNVTNGWVRVASTNMTDPDQECPPSLQLHTDQVRACGSNIDGDQCDTVMYTTHGISYKRVCGRVTGYQFGFSDAFYVSSGLCGYPCTEIDEPYVNGVSITHGNPRLHIWTYAAGLTEIVPLSGQLGTCPCTGIGAAPPSFVGSDYYCESGLSQEPGPPVFHTDDRLWDGQDCGGVEVTCCDPPNLPWFCKDLPQSTTDDLEFRICKDFSLREVNIFIDLLELYIR